MNERIKQFAQEVGFKVDWQHKDVQAIKMERFEKFAELIVQEAIGVLQKRFMGDLNREDMEVRRCIEDVNKHFGVEQ
jgi:hypothetical protein